MYSPELHSLAIPITQELQPVTRKTESRGDRVVDLSCKVALTAHTTPKPE